MKELENFNIDQVLEAFGLKETQRILNVKTWNITTKLVQCRTEFPNSVYLVRNILWKILSRGDILPVTLAKYLTYLASDVLLM